MKRFKIVFDAKILNAIGIRERFTRIIESDNSENAILFLYRSFDHITVLTLEEV